MDNLAALTGSYLYLHFIVHNFERGTFPYTKYFTGDISEFSPRHPEFPPCLFSSRFQKVSFTSVVSSSCYN